MTDSPASGRTHAAAPVAAAAPLSFRVEATCGAARAGRLELAHGVVETPVFMPVGTRAAMRGLTPAELERLGVQIVLSNTYHLMLRPGESIIQKAGGLHRFMGWPHPVLTDSGGYQVFSLQKTEVSDHGVRFRWEESGEPVLLTPERSMEVQQALGADIAMAFDECAPYPCTEAQAAAAVRRTRLWAARSRAAHARPDQALFGIVQGSVYRALREESARDVAALDFPGHAIGGLSVGEGLQAMCEVLDYTAPLLPADRPRYLMGIGFPADVVEAVARGIDMMDCVIPTRLARGASLFTRRGRIRVTDRSYARDLYPVDAGCACYTCTNFSRAYLRHLFLSDEILGTILGALHNVAFYMDLMKEVRASIRDGTFATVRAKWQAMDGTPRGTAARAEGAGPPAGGPPPRVSASPRRAGRGGRRKRS
ncbi:MAG TPA: tRNA guanosine(34) transglycosylase Tgt [Myxococcota bacterium]|nr:tRNA guanosine(34) transglycosylase Tgt [Myxococcota bacterium]